MATIQDFYGNLFDAYNLSGAWFKDYNGTLFQFTPTYSGGGSAVSGASSSGRLSLATGVPVMTANQTAKTVVFWTPYLGNVGPIYNGTIWEAVSSAELSNDLTATTVGKAGPAAAGNASVYHMLRWKDTDGTVRLTRSPAWATATTEGTGAATAQTELLNGIRVNSVAITNGPAAQRGTVVGTILTNGSAQVDWQFGSVAADWGQAIHNVWNMYNRVLVMGMCGDSTDTYTYQSATPQAANAKATARVSFVVGVSEDPVELAGIRRSVDNATTVGRSGFGLDTMVAMSGLQVNGPASGSAGHAFFYAGLPGIGSHFVSCNEMCSNATAAVTFHGDGGLTNYQNGFSYKLRA
jgi:hypothetical protein